MTKSVFNIVADLEHFIVINKTSDCSFHDEQTPGSGLHSQVQSSLNLAELYPVHRIDKMTSGLVIFAKSAKIAAEFGKLFELHKINKYYLALSKNKPKKKQGWIKGDMAKSRRSAWKLLRTMHNPAISQFFSYSINNGLRLFIIRPLSGKTHQIRVALNSIGSPIIGDTIYNPSAQADRGYLHAFALQFELLGESYEFQVNPCFGEYFLLPQVSEKLTELTSPWQLAWPQK
ncbi:TIGR01621 family pseudouridine synthase [Thalassomonas sp. M1454]|uniref:TIGR01621 family pseudouridine synthase n=1 Tax=Thalassomonas sp. M1454 TaxID=2594477 RepID=UPI00117E1247|nr:TIGR01621 family pseudouridine synthase [Thalassomonas sp. M1454]TRX57479.1 TIGR01621 family pseudouridine synthase [Thalassomonas sp. M1454]